MVIDSNFTTINARTYCLTRLVSTTLTITFIKGSSSQYLSSYLHVPYNSFLHPNYSQSYQPNIPLRNGIRAGKCDGQFNILTLSRERAQKCGQV